MSFNLSEIFKILVGILLVQAATGVLAALALRTDNQEIWFLCALLALALCLLTAFWFNSIITHAKKDAAAHVRDGFSKEREKIRVRAEREKTKVIEKSHQQMIKDRSRIQARANTKSTALFAGVLAMGCILVFTQFFTFGLLLISSTGGALAGYLFRSRQIGFGRKPKTALQGKTALKRIGEKFRGEG
ncbi:MAG: hypothetical protein QNJ78_07555 [Gammaproteobacteria bacterium]|nr:hypothetical protein [Gammaproteobacteria bacterium]